MRVSPRAVALVVGAVLMAFLVVLAVLLALRGEGGAPAMPRLAQEHEEVPDFDVTLFDGEALAGASLAGKSYVVNFFNSWCIPCEQEEPELRAFYDAHKGDPDFEMLGIVRDDEESAVRAHVADRGIDWPVAFDTNGSAALGFGTTGQPETYVVAPDGVVVCGALGPASREALESWLTAARTGRQCE